MPSKSKVWVLLIFGAILVVAAGLIELANLGLPYAAISPVLATIGGILIANGWRLLKYIEEKPYAYKDALQKFKKHIKKGPTDRDLFNDLNIWERHAIKAAEDKAYDKLFELFVEIMIVCGSVNDFQYGAITNRVENLIVRFSEDLYVVDKAIPAVLGTVDHFYNKKLYPSAARILVTFGHLCEAIALSDLPQLELVAKHLLSTSKASLAFRNDEELDVFYISIYYRLLWLLEKHQSKDLVSGYKEFLAAQPEKIRLDAEQLAKTNYDFDSLTNNEKVGA